MSISPDSEWFAEQVGLLSEMDGLPRIGGRIFGLLLLSDAPLSLDDLAEQLSASKGSISVDARRLVQVGVIERVSRPGDRRDYYQIAPDFFAKLVAYRMVRWTRLHDLTVEARERITDASPAVQERLHYADEAHAFLLARIAAALEEWKRRG